MIADRRYLALPLLLIPAGCTAPAPDEKMAKLVAEIEEMQRLHNCGFDGAMGFGGGERAKYGEAVRACELPTVAEVERACEVHEAVPNPAKRDPENPGELQHDFPEYSVSGLRCTFDDPGESHATCTFNLAAAAAPPKPTRAALVYRYSAHSTPLVFEQFTYWSTPASCLPSTGIDQAS